MPTFDRVKLPLVFAGLLMAAGCDASEGDRSSASLERSTEQQAGAAPTSRAVASQLVEQSRTTIPIFELGGVRVAELSGLAWDQDEQLLYAVSDQGSVAHFRLTLEDAQITDGRAVYAAELRGTVGAGGRRFNAEGLTVQNASNGKRGDTVLVVSLEGGDQPSIVRFSPAGELLGDLAVPAPANDPANFRKKDQGLESVAFHPEHGLITAPESPLAAVPETHHALYANGRQWTFARVAPDSRLKAISFADDGKLLVLERSEAEPKGSYTASLRRIDLAACSPEGACTADEMIVLPASPNNFEGMTTLGDGRVVIISDHGGRKKDPQTTTLVALAAS